MAYLNLSQFKGTRDIEGSGDDATIALFIDAASKAIDNYCNRTFEGEVEERTFDTPHDRTLWLDDDLCSITSITNGDGSSIDSSQYVTTPRNAFARGKPIYAIRLKSQSPVYWQSDNGEYEDAITVEGVWAYSESPPHDIVQAALMLTAHYYDSKESVGGEAVIIPGVSVRIPQGMPTAVRNILDNGYVKEFG